MRLSFPHLLYEVVMLKVQANVMPLWSTSHNRLREIVTRRSQMKHKKHIKSLHDLLRLTALISISVVISLKRRRP